MYSGWPIDILEAEILGVAEGIKNITEAGATDPVVKATVMLSDRKSTRLNSSHSGESRMPSSA